ncbi:MAG: T9SS type A sorting domain-containing protein [Ignavibacteriae bacterium]|nr:T9SS type A sorting domain-containing protein [Ignavibacteriota bacterium]
MKTRFKIRILLILALPMFAFIAELYAQNEAVSWSAFDMGFAVSSPSSNFAVKSAVGQSFVGTTLLTNTFIESGFLADTLFRGPVVAVHEGNEFPTAFALYQNYPNPFNPSTTIKFDLPRASPVSIKLYNILGQEVATLLNEDREAGRHSLVFNAANLASGIYFSRLQAGSFSDAKKLILLK